MISEDSTVYNLKNLSLKMQMDNFIPYVFINRLYKTAIELSCSCHTTRLWYLKDEA